MNRLWTLGFAISLVALGGCIAPGDDYEDDYEDSEDLDEELKSAGSLDYKCTTTAAGTTCTCNPELPTSDPMSCKGMGAECFGKNQPIVCKYPPSGTPSCSCSF